MRLNRMVFAFGIAALMAGAPTQAYAFCGVIEKTGTGSKAINLLNRLDARVTREVKRLRAKHGKKLRLDEKQSSCVGGDGNRDAQGNKVRGYNRCTITQAYCVNP